MKARYSRSCSGEMKRLSSPELLLLSLIPAKVLLGVRGIALIPGWKPVDVARKINLFCC